MGICHPGSCVGAMSGAPPDGLSPGDFVVDVENRRSVHFADRSASDGSGQDDNCIVNKYK
jgi:hypothetical protein